MSRIPASLALVFIAALFACSALAPPSAWAVDRLPLAVVALEPTPNYEPTSDPGDAGELTDETYQRFPFWTRRESVGWIYRTPIGVTFDAATLADSTYSLVFRSARQSRAGVAPPLRIDVYCAVPVPGAWSHAGSLVHNVGDSADGEVADLSVRFRGCGGTRFKALIHANGGYIMLDEISLARAPDSPALATLLASRVDDPQADSTRRLEPGLMEAAREAIAEAVRALGAGHSYAGLTAPWQALDRPVTTPHLAVHALPSRGARYVIAITNADASAHQYVIESETGGPGAVPPMIQMLQAVLAADGRLVFDALSSPPVPGQLIRLAPGTLAFALVTEAAGAPSSSRRWHVRDDAGWRQTLTVDITLSDAIRPEAVDTPRVLVWAYSRDRPIWSPSGTTATLDRLVEAGVNVFEIHPEDLPQPFAAAEWGTRGAALSRELARYRGRGLVLLLLSREGWQRLAAMDDEGMTRAGLRNWVFLLVAKLREAGYTADDWALYLLDEPHGADVSRLAEVIDQLRQIEPALRFYANPIAESGLDISTVWRLRELKGRIDYWQPKAGVAYLSTRAMLGTDTKTPLWMYAIPPPPARSALPGCYRDIGRLAFDEGARGLGFWSFSDTANSSAWSDFDGDRPDWSVVYESTYGSVFVSGRRWEAFIEGVADHAALRFCARRAGADPRLATQCRAWRTSLDNARPDCPGWW